jgi:hypothetical protein
MIKKQQLDSSKLNKSGLIGSGRSASKTNLVSRLITQKGKHDDTTLNLSTVPKVDFTIMNTLEFLNVSVNDVLEKSIDWSIKDSKWKWELKNYIAKKNFVDHKSLSRIQRDD